MNDWRSFSYPFGFIAAFVFGARFVVQWLESEKAGKSVVSRAFWRLSLGGNIIMVIHSVIQIQYHLCLIQVCNAVISWRNLNLMQTKHKPIRLRHVIWLLIGSLIVISCLFVVQGWFLENGDSWFRIPIAPWQSSNNKMIISPIWHILGTSGFVLFSSRFWIQWLWSEKIHSSELPTLFWWLSLSGAVLSIIYSLRIEDSVNLLGPAIGLIVYIRNLILIYKTPLLAQEKL